MENNIKRTAMEQSFYAQVIRFRRKDLKFDAADENENESKFKFQGQSARSQLWFDLNLDWIDMNFSSRKSDCYNKIFQIHDNEQDINTFRFFQVPIGNAKVVKSFVFHKDAPILSYCQKTLNSRCFSSLASAFSSNKHFKAANALYIRIKESLKSEIGNRIDFANDTLKNKKRNVGESRVHYNLIKYKNMGDYKILEDIVQILP